MNKLSNDRCRELTEALRDAGRLPLRPGVLGLDNTRILAVSDDPIHGRTVVCWEDCGGLGDTDEHPDVSNWVANLNDPATVGVLAGYARELWGSEEVHLVPVHFATNNYRLTWYVNELPAVEDRDTRAEAWIDAILRAPRGGGE